MVEEVNRIIANALLEGSDVALPEVGSLVVVKQAAQVRSRQIVPPSRRIVFSSESRGVSVVQLIEQAGDVEPAHAEELYREWLAQTRTATGLHIASVGDLVGGKWNSGVQFAQLLNPQAKIGAVKVQKRSETWIYVVAVLAIVIAAAAYVFSSTSYGTDLMRWLNSMSAPQPATVVPTPQPETVAPTDTLVVNPADTVEQPTAEPVAATAAAVAPAVQQTEAGIATSVTGRNYVVYGVYMQFSNAAEAMRSIADIAGTNCRIYRYSERFMLSLAESDNRDECAQKAAQLRTVSDKFAQVWIYTKR